MNVLLVDDHPLFREGLKALLMGLDPSVQTEVAASVAQALAHAQGPGVDLVLLDMNLPDVTHVEALRRVKAVFDEVPVVVVSADEDPALILATVDAGAAGYIPKSTDPEVTIQALRLVLAHGIYLPASALRHAPAPAFAASQPAPLSQRQQDVLTRLLQGKPNKIIARELDIAEGTVKAHLWAIYQTLGVSSRAQAMYRVHELGLYQVAGNPPRGNAA